MHGWHQVALDTKPQLSHHIVDWWNSMELTRKALFVCGMFTLLAFPVCGLRLGYQAAPVPFGSPAPFPVLSSISAMPSSLAPPMCCLLSRWRLGITRIQGWDFPPHDQKSRRLHQFLKQINNKQNHGILLNYLVPDLQIIWIQLIKIRQWRLEIVCFVLPHCAYSSLDITWIWITSGFSLTLACTSIVLLWNLGRGFVLVERLHLEISF